MIPELLDQTSRIIVFGPPRSGTSWANEVLNAHPGVRMYYQPVHAYSFPLSSKSLESQQGIEKFFSDLAITDDPFVNMRTGSGASQVELARNDSASVIGFKETHFVEEISTAFKLDKRIKLVYVFRPPEECLDSWYRHPSEYPIGESIEDSWIDGGSRATEKGNLFGMDNWLRVAEAMEECVSLHPERFYLLNYNKAVSNPRQVFGELLNNLGLGWSDKVGSFLEKLEVHSQINPNSVAKPRFAQKKLPDHIRSKVIDHQGVRDLKSRVDWFGL